MSAKAVREYDGKLLLAHWLHRVAVPSTSAEPTTGSKFIQPTTRLAHISIDTSLLQDKAQFEQHVRSTLDQLEVTHPWLLTNKLVAKPDQLIKRRGKSGLLLLNADWADARAWIEKHAAKDVLVSSFCFIICIFFFNTFCYFLIFLLWVNIFCYFWVYFFLMGEKNKSLKNERGSGTRQTPPSENYEKTKKKREQEGGQMDGIGRTKKQTRKTSNTLAWRTNDVFFFSRMVRSHLYEQMRTTKNKHCAIFQQQQQERPTVNLRQGWTRTRTGTAKEQDKKEGNNQRPTGWLGEEGYRVCKKRGEEGSKPISPGHRSDIHSTFTC